MAMSKLFRRIVVVVASAPAVYVAFFTIGWFFTLVVNFLVEGPPVGYFFYHRVILWNLLLISLLAAAGLILATMVHVLVTNRLDAEAKGIWLLLLFMGNIVTLPLYCYLHFTRAVEQLVGPERR